jgi:putative nucleotidyltransferase with HDIG domain
MHNGSDSNLRDSLPLSESLAIQIINGLHKQKHRAYLVGGCVRDRLLGLAPQDFDISTDARPDQILNYFPTGRLVGEQFGVILIPHPNAPEVHVEVATFRSEGLYQDGRRPGHVRFETDPKADVERRDFTMNALLEDPTAEGTLEARVIDYVGGVADLRQGVIRAIGEPLHRFQEDHLRLLRAVRFAARLGFEIEPKTKQAMRVSAAEIQRTAAERVRDELVRILTEGGQGRGVELLDETGLLEQVLPELKACQGVAQPPQFHPEGDVYTHILLMLGLLREPTASLSMGVVLHDIGKPATFRIADRIRFDGHVEVGVEISERILSRLKFSNEQSQQIVALVANHMKFKDLLRMRQSTLKRFLRLPHFEEHLELHRVDCLASNGNLESYHFAKQKLAEFGAEFGPEFGYDGLRPPRLITGRDLMDLGFHPGPAFGTVLEEVETGQLEGTLSTRDAALELARRRLVELGAVSSGS